MLADQTFWHHRTAPRSLRESVPAYSDVRAAEGTSQRMTRQRGATAFARGRAPFTSAGWPTVLAVAERT